MRLFTPEFTRRWYGKMLNIHPSLLPSFPGLDPHGQALRAGVKISGATVHFVIPETDAGPILMQGAVGVSDHDTAETLSERILEVEHRIYPDALRLLASGAVQLDGDICKTPDSAGSRQFPDLAGGERGWQLGLTSVPKQNPPALRPGVAIMTRDADEKVRRPSGFPRKTFRDFPRGHIPRPDFH